MIMFMMFILFMATILLYGKYLRDDIDVNEKLFFHFALFLIFFIWALIFNMFYTQEKDKKDYLISYIIENNLTTKAINIKFKDEIKNYKLEKYKEKLEKM